MNTLLRDLSIIWTLIHCCVMFMLLYESRFAQKRACIAAIIFMIPLIAVNIANVLMFGVETAGRLIIPCCVLPGFIFFFVMAEHRDTRFLFTFCLVNTVVLEVLLATNLLDAVLGLGGYIVMFVSRLVLLPLLEFLMLKYLKKPYRILLQEVQKGWGVFSLMAALFYVALLMFTLYPSIITDRMEYIPYVVLMLILVPVMYAAIFVVLWTQTELLKSEGQNRDLEMQAKMAGEWLDSRSESEKRIKMLRHDMKHHFLILDGYIRNGRCDEAEAYIASLMDDINQSELKSWCENNAANIVLSHYERLGKMQGIELDANIVLPSKLAISETDLTVVLANGLDNAIHAAASCDSDNKHVALKCFVEGDKLYLEISNPIRDAVLFDGAMPRAQRKHHGYGTHSMVTVVEKYGGVSTFTVEDGCFVFRCCM